MISPKLRPIAPFVKGEIVGYVRRQEDEARPREAIGARRWHVVQVKPGCEGRIRARDGDDQEITGVWGEIESNGMVGYVPQEPRLVCVAKGSKHRSTMRPMLPGYVFAGFDPAGELWPTLAQIDGVVRLFMIDGRPVPLADRVMEHIRQTECDLATGGRKRTRLPFGIEVGKLVQIKTPSPFAGFLGFVTFIDNNERSVDVEMDIFGRLTPVNVEPEQVLVV